LDKDIYVLILQNLIKAHPTNKLQQIRTTKQHQQSANTKQQLQNQNVGELKIDLHLI